MRGARPRLESEPQLRRTPPFSFRGPIIGAGLVFVVALMLYSWTLAPTVTLVDSGELIVVANSLGVAHPPGFPFWAILAHLASLIPWGSIAIRVNFASALFGALAAGMLTLAVAEMMITASYAAAGKRLSPQRQSRQERRKSQGFSEEGNGDVQLRPLLVLIPALGSGLLIAFSRTLWSYATITEVYTLNTLLVVVFFFFVLRWRRCIIAERKGITVFDRSGALVPPLSKYDGFLYAGAVAFGLALGVHHVTVALSLPALAVIVWRTEGLRFFTSKRLLFAALFSFAAFVAVYIYLPIAAVRDPIINWGQPRSLQEIWWHITGRQYQVFFSFSIREIGGQFLEFLRMALREFGWPWLPVVLVLAAIGFVNAYREDRTAFWFLVLVLGADLGYAITYSIAEDKDAYYLPAFLSIAVAAGFGFRWLLKFKLPRQELGKNKEYAVACSVVLVAAMVLGSNWPFNNRRHYFIATDYVENLFSTIETNGLLLTMDWQVASPMFYAQQVEQRRRDVKVIDIKLLHRLWYFDYLRQAYPSLIERSRSQVDAYVSDLKAWELDPQSYTNDPARTWRINVAFHEMMHAFVLNEGRIGPVYMTSDVPFADKREAELTKWLTHTFQFVAQGLVFKLETTEGFHDSPDVKLQLRGLADDSLRFEKDDVVTLKVLPVYTSMLVNRGRYLANSNQHERAIAAFKQALLLNPNYALAQQGLQESTDKLRSQAQ